MKQFAPSLINLHARLIQNGSISINKAYEMIKATEAKKKAELLKMRLKKNLLTQAKESIGFI